jgi:hypothetical protein
MTTKKRVVTEGARAQRDLKVPKSKKEQCQALYKSGVAISRWQAERQAVALTNAQRQARSRAAAIAAGKCAECKRRPAKPGCKRCKECTKNAAARQRTV